MSSSVLNRDCVCRYIGGWPSSRKWMPPGNPSVVDCTCELPRHHNNTYLCLPTWDTHGVCPSHVAGICVALLTGPAHCMHPVAHAKHPGLHCCCCLVQQHTGFVSCQVLLAIRLATTASCHIRASPCLPCIVFELQVLRPPGKCMQLCFVSGQTTAHA